MESIENNPHVPTLEEIEALKDNPYLTKEESIEILASMLVANFLELKRQEHRQRLQQQPLQE